MYSCLVCKAAFSTEELRRRHYNDDRAHPTRCQCRTCPSPSSHGTLQRYYAHMTTNHAEKFCIFCCREFKSPHSLRQHESSSREHRQGTLNINGSHPPADINMIGRPSAQAAADGRNAVPGSSNRTTTRNRTNSLVIQVNRADSRQADRRQVIHNLRSHMEPRSQMIQQYRQGEIARDSTIQAFQALQARVNNQSRLTDNIQAGHGRNEGAPSNANTNANTNNNTSTDEQHRQAANVRFSETYRYSDVENIPRLLSLVNDQSGRGHSYASDLRSSASANTTSTRLSVHSQIERERNEGATSSTSIRVESNTSTSTNANTYANLNTVRGVTPAPQQWPVGFSETTVSPQRYPSESRRRVSSLVETAGPATASRSTGNENGRSTGHTTARETLNEGAGNSSTSTRSSWLSFFGLSYFWPSIERTEPIRARNVRGTTAVQSSRNARNDMPPQSNRATSSVVENGRFNPTASQVASGSNSNKSSTSTVAPIRSTGAGSTCCSICLDLETEVSALKCGHVFGTKCLEEAFEYQLRECPVCRYPAFRFDVRRLYLSA